MTEFAGLHPKPEATSVNLLCWFCSFSKFYSSTKSQAFPKACLAPGQTDNTSL